MITELSLENFKSWKSIKQMKLGPITGFFGTNSSGKTSILQLLLMLKQTVESPDRTQALIFGDEKTPVNLGSFQDVVNGHERPGKLSWELKWNRDSDLKIPDTFNPKKILFESLQMGFSADVKGENGKICVEEMKYRLGENLFIMQAIPPSFEKYRLKYNGDSDFEFYRMQQRAWDLPSPVKCYGFPDQVKAYFQNAGFLSDLQLEFEKLFDKVHYLGPLREYPKRQYIWAGSEPIDMGQRGERVVDALLSARQYKKYIGMGRGSPKRTLEEHIAFWLKSLGLIHDFFIEQISKDSNIYRIKVTRNQHSTPVLLTDVGFGVSQILPVLVLCFYADTGSTIILEQPEIHLHPLVQAGLADVFIDAVKRRKIQIIFESHSEHLLRRLQRRIAEGSYLNQDASLYFCEMANGASSLSSLELDEFGNIKNWPKDFFGDEFGEMAAMTKAAMERKAAEET